MANAKHVIGLSLGADICWPICFEELAMEKLADRYLETERFEEFCHRAFLGPDQVLAQDR